MLFVLYSVTLVNCQKLELSDDDQRFEQLRALSSHDELSYQLLRKFTMSE